MSANLLDLSGKIDALTIAIFDAIVTITIANDMVVLAVTNLSDEDYYQAIGFPGAGLRARLGVRYQF